MKYVHKICVDCGKPFDAPICAAHRMRLCKPCRAKQNIIYHREYSRQREQTYNANRREMRRQMRAVLAEAVDNPVSDEHYQCRVIGCAISQPGRNWQ